MNTNQQLLKRKFSIPKIKVLFENDREDNTPVIELQLKSMEAEFSKSSHDMKLFAALHDACLSSSSLPFSLSSFSLSLSPPTFLFYMFSFFPPFFLYCYTLSSPQVFYA